MTPASPYKLHKTAPQDILLRGVSVLFGVLYLKCFAPGP
jgi:hypothetical protein